MTRAIDGNLRRERIVPGRAIAHCDGRRGGGVAEHSIVIWSDYI
jgi:hypothetical protein